VNDQKETCTDQATPRISPPAWSAAKRIVRIVVGVILMILGLAALFTPFTPGSWLALVGLEFLGLRILLRNRMCAWAQARPDSKFRRATCRIFHVDGFEAMKRKWRQHRPRGAEIRNSKHEIRNKSE
jgi:hypothetical protein